MAYYYLAVPWRLGAIHLVWHTPRAVHDATSGRDQSTERLAATESPFRLCRILLPVSGTDPVEAIQAYYPEARPGTAGPAEELAHDLSRYLEGEGVTFSLASLDLSSTSPFQRKVLLAEHAIPYGYVTTYQEIARQIGHPQAARAVGTALGRNPFPIMIPCHRAVRSDGHLGGYAGGLAMKKALLALEGVHVDSRGRVPESYLTPA